MTGHCFRELLHGGPLFVVPNFLNGREFFLPRGEHEVHHLMDQREAFRLRNFFAVYSDDRHRESEQRNAAHFIKLYLAELKNENTKALHGITPSIQGLPLTLPFELYLDVYF